MKIFDSPMLPPPSPTITLHTNADFTKKIFKVEPSQRQLSDFNPDEDLYHLSFSQNAKVPTLNVWHNGDLFPCPISRDRKDSKGSFKLSEDREEKGFETLQAQYIYIRTKNS